MPPEEPQGLVALSLDFDKGALLCRGERVFPRQGQLKISWYTASTRKPESYIPILDGLVVAYKSPDPQAATFRLLLAGR